MYFNTDFMFRKYLTFFVYFKSFIWKNTYVVEINSEF
jgi:hypothetical protein